VKSSNWALLGVGLTIGVIAGAVCGAVYEAAAGRNLADLFLSADGKTTTAVGQVIIGIGQIIPGIFGIIMGLATVSISAFGFFHSKRAQKLQAINLYISNWRQMNGLFLENTRARNARAALANRHPTELDDIYALVAIYINQALLAYYAWTSEVMPTNERDEEFKHIWMTLSSRAHVVNGLLHSEGYPERFVELFSRCAPKASQ